MLDLLVLLNFVIDKPLDRSLMIEKTKFYNSKKNNPDIKIIFFYFLV